MNECSRFGMPIAFNGVSFIANHVHILMRGVLGAYGLWFLAKILYGLWFWEKKFMVYGFSEVPKILWFMVFNC